MSKLRHQYPCPILIYNIHVQYSSTKFIYQNFVLSYNIHVQCWEGPRYFKFSTQPQQHQESVKGLALFHSLSRSGTLLLALTYISLGLSFSWACTHCNASIFALRQVLKKTQKCKEAKEAKGTRLTVRRPETRIRNKKG